MTRRTVLTSAILFGKPVQSVSMNQPVSPRAQAIAALPAPAAGIASRLAASLWTQEQAAGLLGMSRISLNFRLNGRTRWAADELPAVASLLGCSIADLYEDVSQ